MIRIQSEKCIGCGKCAEDCLANKIKVEYGKAIQNGDCIECGHCVAICPCEAISIPEYDMADVKRYTKEERQVEPEKLLASIKFRRSIRDYVQKPVEQEKLEMLLQAGRYTATAKNNQGCYFVFVQNELETVKKMVWEHIDELLSGPVTKLPKEMVPFLAFNRQRKMDPANDYLFRNAPVVLFITSDWPLDAGLAAQNIETMANAMGLGVLFNGYLARVADANEGLKEYLGIKGQNIKACMLLGYPNVSYVRTAPRKEANVIWK